MTRIHWLCDAASRGYALFYVSRLQDLKNVSHVSNSLNQDNLLTGSNLRT